MPGAAVHEHAEALRKHQLAHEEELRKAQATFRVSSHAMPTHARALALPTSHAVVVLPMVHCPDCEAEAQSHSNCSDNNIVSMLLTSGFCWAVLQPLQPIASDANLHGVCQLQPR